MTEIGNLMIQETYVYKDERTPQDVFKRVAKGVSKGDSELCNRIYSYLNSEYFMFATPILANIGTDRGAPISCFVNEVDDSKEGIFQTLDENNWLGSIGGGIGTDWSRVREVNAPISNKGKSSGVIPFIKISDASTLAVSQGGLRRAAQAVYLDISHPEIEEFIDIRKEEGADNNRRCSNIHHAVKISDKFMQAVENGESWDLVSPKTNKVVGSVDARKLFYKILTCRIERGEPYIFFTDNVNKHLPTEYVMAGKKVKLSNLCTEILQYTDSYTTAVCALCSLNLAKYDEWSRDQQFFDDIVESMNNVLNTYLQHTAESGVGFRTINSVTTERNIGIGVMGWHTLLQSKMIPFESAVAEGLNRKVFSNISERITEASIKANPKHNGKPYNVLRTAIAPTSSISLICGQVSAGIEPILANCFTHKIQQGTFVAKNPILEKLLMIKGRSDAWKSIIEHNGSVQHLDFLTDLEKEVFKTAFEIDQQWVIHHASIRQEFIDQGQSLNLFLPADVSKLYLFQIHHLAWKRGIKTLYYLRSTPVARVGLSGKVERKEIKYDECLSCQ